MCIIEAKYEYNLFGSFWEDVFAKCVRGMTDRRSNRRMSWWTYGRMHRWMTGHGISSAELSAEIIKWYLSSTRASPILRHSLHNLCCGSILYLLPSSMLRLCAEHLKQARAVLYLLFRFVTVYLTLTQGHICQLILHTSLPIGVQYIWHAYTAYLGCIGLDKKIDLYLTPERPWPLTSWTQNVISTSKYHVWYCDQIWTKSLQRKDYAQMHGHTYVQTTRKYNASGPDGQRHKNWIIQSFTHLSDIFYLYSVP